MRYAKEILRHPTVTLRTLLATGLFLLFLQAFYLISGTLDWAIVAALPVYLLLGFVPTLLGLSLALSVQALALEPVLVPQLVINSLALILPLIAVHYTLARKLSRTTNGHHADMRTLLKLSGAYYAGVATLMGCGLLITQASAPFAAWSRFAAACLVVVALEPLVTALLLRARQRFTASPLAHVSYAAQSS